ncbi:MAG: hypothetical protein ACYDH4_09555 [Candidatus Cryosericum sp.]
MMRTETDRLWMLKALEKAPASEAAVQLALCFLLDAVAPLMEQGAKEGFHVQHELTKSEQAYRYALNVEELVVATRALIDQEVPGDDVAHLYERVTKALEKFPLIPPNGLEHAHGTCNEATCPWCAAYEAQEAAKKKEGT